MPLRKIDSADVSYYPLSLIYYCLIVTAPSAPNKAPCSAQRSRMQPLTV